MLLFPHRQRWCLLPPLRADSARRGWGAADCCSGAAFETRPSGGFLVGDQGLRWPLVALPTIHSTCGPNGQLAPGRTRPGRVQHPGMSRSCASPLTPAWI